MEKKLTNEEIAKVRSLYWGQEVLKYEGDKDLYPVNGHNIECHPMFLSLTPLSKISDEDAIEVAGGIKNGWELFKIVRSGSVFCHIKIRRRYEENEIDFNEDSYKYESIYFYHNSLTANQHQYLISKSYAVPLFFAPNHWANGKTAIELNIAIDATIK